MKKSNFVAMIEEWNVFKLGVAVGCVGLVFALITVLVWRKMENKAPIKLQEKQYLR